MESAFIHESPAKRRPKLDIKTATHRARAVYRGVLGRRYGKHAVIAAGVSVVGGLVLFAAAPTPAIDLQLPKANTTSQAEQLYVKGTVKPANAQVKVNGKAAQTDGNGLFTVFIDAPVGDSVLQVTASYLGRRATFLEPVGRTPTLAEQQAVTRKQLAHDQGLKQTVLGEDTKIQTLLAKSHDGDITHVVNVTDHSEKKQGLYTRVVGTVRNQTPKPVYWVTVTANFYDAEDHIVDTKQGIAVGQNEQLATRATHAFETMASFVPSVYYKLIVDWKDSPTVATHSATFDGNSPGNLTLPTPPEGAALQRKQFPPQ
jgi:hypothetical protein